MKAKDRSTVSTGNYTGHPVRVLENKFAKEILEMENPELRKKKLKQKEQESYDWLWSTEMSMPEVLWRDKLQLWYRRKKYQRNFDNFDERIGRSKGKIETRVLSKIVNRENIKRNQ